MGGVKVAAVSDLHGHLPKIPKSDIVLIAGDIVPSDSLRFQKHWLDTAFRNWLEDIEGEVFACAGNHDEIFQELPEKVPRLPWNYLQDESAEYMNLKIYGTPWQKRFYDWAFNLDEADLARKWQEIPEDTDILITHGPPRYFGDLVSRGTHEGSPSLLKRIMEINPKLVVYGHIHHGRGEYPHNGVMMANVTVVNESCKMVYEPWVYEIE